jgi:cytochrome P450
VQQRIHAELDRVINGDRLITVADKSQLPYMNATVVEIQRVANIFSINLPRKAAKDVEFEGHLIRQGTVVMPQISVIMNDPDVS